MLRSLKLSRFRGFSTLHVELGSTTAIVGRNSSGKTSVLRAIRLVCDVLDSVVENDDEEIRPRLKGAGHTIEVCQNTVVSDPSRFIALAEWTQLFTDASVGDGVALSIELGFEEKDIIQEARLEFAYRRNAPLKMNVLLRSKQIAAIGSGFAAKSKDRPARLLEEIRRARPLCVLVPAFYGVTSVEEYRTQPVVNRLLGGGDQSHIVRNLLARMDRAAIERMNTFLRRTIGAELLDRTPQADAEQRGRLFATYRDTNGALEISSAGAGLVGMIALYAAMERMRAMRSEQPVIFLLDEPEAHLHPRLQADVGEELARLADEFGHQLILATHSVEMINRLGRLPHSVLLTVDRSNGTSARLSTEDQRIRALDEFCDLTPFASLSFLSTRRVLFHEGPTDFQALDACARLHFRSDDERMARWKQYISVPLDGVGNVSAEGVLERVLTPSLFMNLDEKRAVRAALVLDRDWSRAPRSAQLRKNKPHLYSIEAVWSRHSIESLFLDAPCLAEWLTPLLPGSDLAEVRQLLEKTTADVNHDQELEEEAADARYAFHRRPDPQTKLMMKETAALKAARAEVRADPAIWHHGKKRASKILRGLRSALGAKGNKLQGSLIDLLVRAPTDQIADSRAAIPEELRSLLDECVQS
jgi:ABC-type cobalamin/Fe3+-siderophores transport system ATPase subunit